MGKIKTAIIGLGTQGRKYALIIGNNDLNLELTAVCSSNKNTPKWLEENIKGKVSVYSTEEEMYSENKDIEAVVVCNPHPCHPQTVLRAFKEKKQVLCEKPAATDIKTAYKMYKAAEEEGCAYALMFHQRAFQKFKYIKSLLSENKIGTLMSFSWENTEYYRTAFYHNSSPWRSSWQGEGGGVLINQGAHPLDMLTYLFGMPQKLYSEIPFGKYNDFSVDDEASLFLEYNNKLTGRFFVSTGEIVGENRLSVSGTKGKIVMEGDEVTLYTYSEDLPEYSKNATCTSTQDMNISKTEKIFQTSREDPYSEMFENFAATCRKEELPIASGKEGIDSLMLTNAAYLSAWKNEKVTLPLDMEEYQKEFEKNTKE